MQEVPSPPTKPNHLITCFGTGDGWPSGARGQSSFLYQLEKTAFLLDCGEPISRAYKASGLSYDLPEAIVLSHLHMDHIGGFFMLMQSLLLEKRTRRLSVFLPADGIEPLRAVLRAATLFDEVLSFGIDFHAIEVSRPILLGGVRITPFPSSHLDKAKESFQGKYPLRFEAFSFLIESGGWRIAHSADIGSEADLLPLLEKPLDLLICELAHVAPEKLFPLLRATAVRRTALVHISREYRSRLAEIQRDAVAALGKERVQFPSDGERLLL